MMRMVMESAGLTIWPVTALLIFTLATMMMILWIYRRDSEKTYDRLRWLAVGDEAAEAEARTARLRHRGGKEGRHG